jgi:hypothetical protein
VSDGAAPLVFTETVADENPMIQKNERVTYRDLASGEGGVLLHLESGQYHGVNRVGALVWELLDGEHEEESLILEVRRQIADPPPQLEEEVRSFLDALRERDLISG